MTDEQCLFDRTPADRALDRYRQAKIEAAKESRREWGWCFVFAAVVAVALKFAGAI